VENPEKSVQEEKEEVSHAADRQHEMRANNYSAARNMEDTESLKRAVGLSRAEESLIGVGQKELVE
jgi:hypothetical protein